MADFQGVAWRDFFRENAAAATTQKLGLRKFKFSASKVFAKTDKFSVSGMLLDGRKHCMHTHYAHLLFIFKPEFFFIRIQANNLNPILIQISVTIFFLILIGIIIPNSTPIRIFNWFQHDISS